MEYHWKSFEMNGSSEDVVRFFCLGVRVHLPGFREITPPSARYTIKPVSLDYPIHYFSLLDCEYSLRNGKHYAPEF